MRNRLSALLTLAILSGCADHSDSIDPITDSAVGEDASTPEVDASTPDAEVDSAIPEVDSALPEVDASTPDAGSTQVTAEQLTARDLCDTKNDIRWVLSPDGKATLTPGPTAIYYNTATTLEGTWSLTSTLDLTLHSVKDGTEIIPTHSPVTEIENGFQVGEATLHLCPSTEDYNAVGGIWCDGTGSAFQLSINGQAVFWRGTDRRSGYWIDTPKGLLYPNVYWEVPEAHKEELLLDSPIYSKCPDAPN